MCKKCGKTITQTSITRSSRCEFCGADLHTCLNCKFFAPGSHYDCRETIAEPVREKESANFCDYFSVRTSFTDSSLNAKDKAALAKSAFNALFGN